ncbi:MAG: hypothetical protein KAR38_12155 [Calditrichia bacterium]|nr:hypothetical protein [Calditrichia bacterium]
MKVSFQNPYIAIYANESKEAGNKVQAEREAAAEKTNRQLEKLYMQKLLNCIMQMVK